MALHCRFGQVCCGSFVIQHTSAPSVLGLVGCKWEGLGWQQGEGDAQWKSLSALLGTNVFKNTQKPCCYSRPLHFCSDSKISTAESVPSSEGTLLLSHSPWELKTLHWSGEFREILLWPRWGRVRKRPSLLLSKYLGNSNAFWHPKWIR